MYQIRESLLVSSKVHITVSIREELSDESLKLTALEKSECIFISVFEKMSSCCLVSWVVKKFQREVWLSTSNASGAVQGDKLSWLTWLVLGLVSQS